MSPEFITGFTESDIEKTCQATEVVLAHFPSAKEFLDTAVAEYASQPEDRAELTRMIRVAEFVTGPGTIATPEAIRAFFYGEVAAADLIRRLPAEQERLGSHAHEYLKSRLAQSREAALHRDQHETALEILQRNNLEARRIRNELITPTHPMPESLEIYINTITAQFKDKVPERHYTGMGFRLVMQEFLYPNSHLSTPETLQEVDALLSQSDEYAEYRAAIEAAYAKEPEGFRGAPSIAATEAILGNDPGITDIIKTRSKDDARKEILTHFLVSKQAFNEVALKNDPGFIITTKHLWEKSLRELVATEHLFTKDDLLIVNGDYFAITSNGETNSVGLFNSTEEVVGMFEGIYLVEAPTAKELKRALARAADYNPEAKKETALTPVVRIKDQTFTQHNDRGEDRIIHGTGLTIDIPLIYKTASIKSVLPPEYNYLSDDADRA